MCSAGRNSSASTRCAPHHQSRIDVNHRQRSEQLPPLSPDEVRAGPCRASRVRTGHRTTRQTTPTRVHAPPSGAVRPSKPAPVAAVLLRLRLRPLLRAPSASPLDCRRQRRWWRFDRRVLRLALRRSCTWEPAPRLGRGQGQGPGRDGTADQERDGCGGVGIEDVERPGDDDDDGIGRRPRSCNRRRRRGRLRHAADADAGGDVAGGVRCW
jgi:hypothetical protein